METTCRVRTVERSKGLFWLSQVSQGLMVMLVRLETAKMLLETEVLSKEVLHRTSMLRTTRMMVTETNHSLIESRSAR